MYLKKKLIQEPFSNKKAFYFSYYDEIDLKNGILKLCKYLKKGSFLIQVFLGDEFNDFVIKYSNISLKNKNFNYYLVDNLNFFSELSLAGLRFLNVYSLSKNVNSIDSTFLKEIDKIYTYMLGLDNYLEHVEIIINYDYYDKQTIENILKFKKFPI